MATYVKKITKILMLGYAEEPSRRTRMKYYVMGASLGIFAYFAFFLGVALWEVPAPLLIIPIVTTAVSVMIGIAAPMPEEGTRKGNMAEAKLMIWNILAIVTILAGTFLLILEFDRGSSIIPGFLVVLCTGVIYGSGWLVFYGRCPD